MIPAKVGMLAHKGQPVAMTPPPFAVADFQHAGFEDGRMHWRTELDIGAQVEVVGVTQDLRLRRIALPGRRPRRREHAVAASADCLGPFAVSFLQTRIAVSTSFSRTQSCLGLLPSWCGCRRAPADLSGDARGSQS